MQNPPQPANCANLGACHRQPEISDAESLYKLKIKRAGGAAACLGRDGEVQPSFSSFQR